MSIFDKKAPIGSEQYVFLDPNGTSKVFLSEDELHCYADSYSQKAKADDGKPQLRLVPTQIIEDIAIVREYGNAKYPDGGPDNWKTVDIERYKDAFFRHWLLYLNDPDGIDEESGLPHLWHCACNMAFLCAKQQYRTIDFTILRMMQANNRLKEQNHD